MANPRILTFNFHEPYLCLMAKTGLEFTVGLYNDPPMARPWQTQFRPIPENMTLVEEHVWRRDLMANRFDVVIAHNETNAANIYPAQTPKLLVCHNRKTFLVAEASSNERDPVEAFEELLRRLQERFTFIFISESKRADYGVPGKVIPPGIDVDDLGGYAGEVAEVLRVGNMMRARNLMFDVDFQEEVCRGFPNQVLGCDPEIPGARQSESFEELLDFYRTRRCLLHVTRQEYEDGYNLVALEAMACGMPVVSLANRTSPLTDGVDGFVSFDANVLRQRIGELLENLDLAREIGARGRETVAKKFPIKAFAQRWRNAIEEAAESSRRFTPRSRPRPQAVPDEPAAPSLGIVMQFVSTPITTGRYFERAARKRHSVVTAGLRCPEEVFDIWGFEAKPPPYPAQDIDIPLDGTCRQILDGLPKGFSPDVFLWIDSGPKSAPADIDTLAIPKACYLIDTHLEPELRMDIAHHFDFTFLAQKGQVGLFRYAGIKNVMWLPVACSPELHDVGSFERIYDIAYVGSPRNDAGERRRGLLKAIAERFPKHKIGQFWPDDMARDYAQSRIVFNACVNRDVNMRVFEAMASGALLITDEADGLEDLFEDGKHLVIYRKDDELFDLIEKHLADDEARERIASAGRALVHERHTYDDRVERMLAEVVSKRPRLTGAAVAHQPMAGGDASEAWYAEGGYYRNRRPEVAQHVPPTARRVLDVGCGGGDFGAGLKEQGVAEVVGIEAEERAWKLAKEVLDDALLGNIEEMDLPFEDGWFDCVTFADVLEHLVDPAAALRKVARVLADDGVIVMSIPNVGFYEVVAMLANGRWTYTEAGILDRTHLRFFTAIEARQMVEKAGLEVLCLEPLSFQIPDKLPRNPDGSLTIGRVTISGVTAEEYQDFLTYQYLVIAGKPGADRLAKAQQALEFKEYEVAYALASYAWGVDDVARKRIQASAIAHIGKLDKAEKLYREALEIQPDHPRVTGELGVLLVAMNRPQEAESYLERAVEADPQNDTAVAGLGLVYLKLGRVAEALDKLKQALEANFNNIGVLAPCIALAAELNRLDEIENMVRRYAEFYPGNTEISVEYAELLAKLDRIGEARDRLEMVLALDPNCEPARELLARISREGE